MGHGGDGAIDGETAAVKAAGVTLDRSKVHVLVCDKDPDAGLHVMKLLQQCLYQVTCVKSAGQVLGVLDSCSYEVDLILSEVELPKEKGLKMLKHIVRREQLHRIPIVMMSARDEMALVVKCLRLGAVDYLLKPLRVNELLNLWTHTWRRRRMLGLSEKHLMNENLRIPFDLLVSETSESNNTNSTNLFSNDTDDLKRTVPICEATGNFASCGMESEVSPQLELSLRISLDMAAEVASSKGGLVTSFPKKTELKIGQSSAFLTYAKASNQLSGRSVKAQCDAENGIPNAEQRSIIQTIGHGKDDKCLKTGDDQVHLGPSRSPDISKAPPGEPCSRVPPYPWVTDVGRCENEADCAEKSGTSRNCAPVPYDDLTEGRPPSDQSSFENFHGENEGVLNVSNLPTLPASHFLAGGMMGSALHSPSLLLPSIHSYPGLPTMDDGAGIAPGFLSVHGVTPNHGLPLATPFTYYPFGLHIAPPQLGSFPGWPSMAATLMVEHKLGQAERREAALEKFRRKRKDRCFNKKIRYVTRKKLAEQRPRIKGQFVRRGNGKDINDSGVFDEYGDEDDDDEQGIDDLGVGSSPEIIAEDPERHCVP